jgi:hypothetical protein
VNVDDEDDELWVLVALRPLLETLFSSINQSVCLHSCSSSFITWKKKQSNKQGPSFFVYGLKA